MNKKCEIGLKKLCDNCGECDICDLDSKKICDNCGKCLETDKETDARGIAIDEILEDQDLSDDLTEGTDGENLTDTTSDSALEYEFLEDFKNLNAAVSELKEKETSDKAYEAYPGLIIVGRKTENEDKE